ncbi:hypothetical protein [Lacticaseibacillus suibinensis]|uniref:hypothetical protein n=1 Tax=Lacticaseibacillus suibinensis TaxID=2486011 RepID=UPI0019452EE3|nr:hypothetical protein [Lacticaseibacillus suibinensis]
MTKLMIADALLLVLIGFAIWAVINGIYKKKIRNGQGQPMTAGETLFVVTVAHNKFVECYSEYDDDYSVSGNSAYIFGLYKDAKNCADAVGGQVVTLMVAQE